MICPRAPLALLHRDVSPRLSGSTAPLGAGTMPHWTELLRRYSLELLADAQELRQQAAAARQRSAKCKAMAKEAAVVAQTARVMADAMRKRQRKR
jgi:hypothetical protein